MAHAKSYPRAPEAVLTPIYETRPATEADIKWLAPRLTQSTLDEVSTLSKYQPVSFLLQDMERKRVVVDWSNSNQPVAIIDIKPVEGWDEAHVWLGLTGSATSEANKEAFAKFCRTLFDQLNKNHRQLLYHVAASNFTQSRWLEQFGFLPHRRLSHYGDKQVEYFVLRRSPANV